MAVAPAAAVPTQSATPAACEASGALHFVGHAPRPEDLALVPGGGWLIASRFDARGDGGLTLIDTRRGAATPARLDLASARDGSPGCPTPPDPRRLSTQGLYMLPTGPTHGRLFVVGHGGREAVEVFEVDTAGAQPSLTWVGCRPGPPGAELNAVAALPDGRLFVSAFLDRGATRREVRAGRDTGRIYAWTDGAGFRPQPGTDLPGPNGLEVTGDGRFLLVAAAPDAVVRYDLADTRAAPVRIAAGFETDNLRRAADGRIVVAGAARDPDCRGSGGCATRVAAALLEPAAMRLAPLFRSSPERRFPGASTGLLDRDTLWLGSWKADRAAYVRLASGGPADPGNAPSAGRTGRLVEPRGDSR